MHPTSSNPKGASKDIWNFQYQKEIIYHATRTTSETCPSTKIQPWNLTSSTGSNYYYLSNVTFIIDSGSPHQLKKSLIVSDRIFETSDT